MREDSTVIPVAAIYSEPKKGAGRPTALFLGSRRFRVLAEFGSAKFSTSIEEQGRREFSEGTLRYSARNAIAGSTRAARQAGIQQATRETTRRRATIAT